jgi:hypothetical protein
MLRSKFHHPWQPRVSDGQMLNPFAQSNPSETSFSEEIEEAERDVPEPASNHTAADTESGSNLDAVKSPYPRGPQR